MIEIYVDAPVLHVNIKYFGLKADEDLHELSFERGDIVRVPWVEVDNSRQEVNKTERDARIMNIYDDHIVLDASKQFESRIIKEPFVHFKDIICGQLLRSGHYDDLDTMNTNITVTKEKRIYYTDSDNSSIERFSIGDIIKVKNKLIPTSYIGKLVNITDIPTAELDCSTPVNSCIKTITPATDVVLEQFC